MMPNHYSPFEIFSFYEKITDYFLPRGLKKLLLSIFSSKYLEVWILFITFAFVILRMVSDESLALIQGLAYFRERRVLYVFFLTS